MQSWMRPRQAEQLPVRLQRNRIYVLPTMTGLFFGLLLGTMGLGALNFNNNPALLLALLLAGAAQASLIAAHMQLSGVVVDAVFRGAPWPLSLNDLVTAFPKTPDLDLARRSLATTLMGYALASPDTIRGRPHPAIVCDPAAGLRVFEKSVQVLRDFPAAGPGYAP